MTTWTWECLLDGETGTASSHEDAIAAAQEHNSEAEHESPSISYGHDDPPPPEPPPPPDVNQLLLDLCGVMKTAKSWSETNDAFAALEAGLKGEA